MPTGASSIAGSPPMSIGACPTISLLTRSIRPLAFDTMRPVASSNRSPYVSIVPRLVFCARVAVVRAAGGFARARDVAGRRCVRRWAARDRRVGRSGRRSLLGARRERRGFECRRSRRRGRIAGYSIRETARGRRQDERDLDRAGGADDAPRPCLASALEAQDILEPRAIVVGLREKARRHRRRRHDGKSLRPHFEIHVWILTAIDRSPVRLGGARLEHVPIPAPIHDDLHLVVRVQRCLQAQNELAAL